MITRTIICIYFYALLGTTLLFEKNANLGTLLRISGRIINGENAAVGQFPWQAAVSFETNMSSWLCGGSIISEEWILTAASCLYNTFDAFAYTGIVNLTKLPRPIQVRKFYPHEGYDPTTLANDIGLMQLKENLTFNDDIAPIALASEPLEAGEEVTVSGFGATATDGPDTSQFLNYITMTTITNSECTEFYGDAILEGMVCTSAGSDLIKGTCFGDTGGPAVLAADTDPILVGIASFLDSTGCENGRPSGFTRTAYYRDWIRERTGV